MFNVSSICLTTSHSLIGPAGSATGSAAARLPVRFSGDGSASERLMFVFMSSSDQWLSLISVTDTVKAKQQFFHFYWIIIYAIIYIDIGLFGIVPVFILAYL